MNYKFSSYVYKINNRKMRLSRPNVQTLSESNIKNTKINETTGPVLLKKICTNVIESNLFYSDAVDILCGLNSIMNDADYKNLVANFCNTIPYNVKRENMNGFEKCVKESNLDSNTKERILENVNEVKTLDRIINNAESLSTRFNINKIIKGSGVGDAAINECVSELCELIDTYNLPIDAKLNIALENINYSMTELGKSGADNSDTIIEYYLGTNPVITDKTMGKIKNVIESNIFITNETRDRYISLLESSGKQYTRKLEIISKDCDDPNNAEFILNVKKIKNEKQASMYIKTALNRIASMSMTDADRKRLMQSILLIPMIGNVSDSFVQYELGLQKRFIDAKQRIEDQEFVKVVDDILDIEDIVEDDDIDEYCDGINKEKLSKFLDESVLDSDDLFSDVYESDVLSMLVSEQVSDTDEIKELLAKFNADQDKSIGRFKNAISKIYKKSPKAIINSMPNIFSIVRVVFILGTFTIPVVGPIVGIVLALIDRLLSMDINRKQSERLIKALDDEKELVKKKIDKGGNKTEELEKYLKCIERCTDRVEAYRNTITDDDIEGRPSDFDDDLDFEFEDCKDFYMYTDSIEKILEAKKSGIMDKITSNVDLLVEAGIVDVLEVFKRCPNTVDFASFEDRVYRKFDNFPISEEANKFYSSEFNTPIYEEDNVLDDLLFERCAIEEFETVVTEGINLSTIKLAMQNVKKKFKDLSTKEKEVCQTIDVHMSQFMKNVEKSMTSNRREALIKGSMIPSFSKCLKSALVVGGAAVVNPVLGMITAMGMIGTSKKLNQRERQLIFDEIDTELKVVEKQIQIAENDGDMNQYRFLLQYQKKLDRERQRIKYGLKVNGRDIPAASAGRKEDF